MPIASLSDTTAWLDRIAREDWSGVENKDLVRSLREDGGRAHPIVREALIKRLMNEVARIARDFIPTSLVNSGQDIVDDVQSSLAQVLIMPAEANQAKSGAHVYFYGFFRSRSIDALRDYRITPREDPDRPPALTRDGRRTRRKVRLAAPTRIGLDMPIGRKVAGGEEMTAHGLEHPGKPVDEEAIDHVAAGRFMEAIDDEEELRLLIDYAVADTWTEIQALRKQPGDALIPMTTLRDTFAEIIRRRLAELEAERRERRAAALRSARARASQRPKTHPTGATFAAAQRPESMQ